MGADEAVASDPSAAADAGAPEPMAAPQQPGAPGGSAGAAASEADRPDPVNIMDVAADVARGLLADGEPGPKPPRAPGVPVPPTVTPSPGLPAPVSTPQSADPLAALGASLAGLPEAARAPVEQAIAQVTAFRGELEHWAAGFAQQQEALAAEQQRIAAIAQHPRFQQALAAAIGQPASPGNGQTPPGQPAFEPETDNERHLYGGLQAQNVQIQQLLARQAEVDRQVQEAAERGRQERIVALHADIGRAHAELDARYPELKANPKRYNEWHELASRIWQPGMDLREALDKAARVLHYDQAKAAGASGALEAARKAARHSTTPDGRVNRSRAGPPDESIVDVGRRLAGEMGIPF